MTQGIISTNQLNDQLVARSFAQAVMRYMPAGTAPLFGLTSMLKTEIATQTNHGYFSKTMVFPGFTLAADITATDTVIPVVSTVNLIEGQIHELPLSTEQVIIDNIISATAIRVTRAIGTSPAVAATSGDNAYQVGAAFEEGSVRPTALSIATLPLSNFTQIFRNSWAVTDTARATLTVAGEGTVAESKMDATAFHAKDIETALIFGQKFIGNRKGMPFRKMEGLIPAISNITYYPSSFSTPNVNVAGSTTTFNQLESYLDPSFNQATDPKIANQRLLFVGGTAKRVLTNIGRLSGVYQMMQGQTEWGMQFDKFKTSRGNFTVIEHPLFNSNPYWNKMALSVDMSTFNIAYLGDRKTQHKMFNTSGEIASDNGIDAIGGTFTTELTCLVKNPPANSVIYNLTAAAA